MPVSLARRIRRIGLLPSTKDDKGNRVHNFDPDMTAEAKEVSASYYRHGAKLRRLAAFPKKTVAIRKAA